jgi:septum site-determining protein MinC
VPSAHPVHSRQAIRLRARSFMAFLLTPAPPIDNWLEELDRWIKASPDFFVARPIILDLAALRPDEPEIARLIAKLGERKIRIIGLEGVDPALLSPSLPPCLKGGDPTAGNAATEPGAGPTSEKAGGGQPARDEPTSVLLENPIRSGQSVIFPHGDVTVAGFGGFGRRSRRRRIDPHLRRVAWASHGGLHG